MFHRNKAIQANQQNEAPKAQKPVESQSSATSDKQQTEGKPQMTQAQQQQNQKPVQQPMNKPADIPNSGGAPFQGPFGNPSGFQQQQQQNAVNQQQQSQPAQQVTQPVSPDMDEDGRRLVISEGINMSGDISACDSLVVEGVVEATLEGAKRVEIAESGVFYGSIEIEEATIAGTFEGDLVVDGTLIIHSTGKVRGSIAYRELMVEAGAQISGKIAPIGEAFIMEEEEPARKSKPKKKAKNKKFAKKVAAKGGNDNQLPFENQQAVAAE